VTQRNDQLIGALYLRFLSEVVPFSIAAVAAGGGTEGMQCGGGMLANGVLPVYQGEGRGQVWPLRIRNLS